MPMDVVEARHAAVLIAHKYHDGDERDMLRCADWVSDFIINGKQPPPPPPPAVVAAKTTAAKR